MFGIETALCAETADAIYDHVDACIAEPEFTPRALFERLNIEVLTTTEGVLEEPDQISSSAISAKVLPWSRRHRDQTKHGNLQPAQDVQLCLGIGDRARRTSRASSHVLDEA